MKLSDLIAKGRRTVLKISPPKNPRKFTGAVIQKAWSIRAARGHRIASALATTDVDQRLRQILRPSLPAPLLGSISRCLPEIPSPRLLTPAQDLRGPHGKPAKRFLWGKEAQRNE